MKPLASVRSLSRSLAILTSISAIACTSPSPYPAPLVYDGVATVPKRFEGVDCVRASGSEGSEEPAGEFFASGTLDVSSEGFRYAPVTGDPIEIPWSRVTGVMWERVGPSDRAVVVQKEAGRSTMIGFGTQPSWIFRTIKYAAEVLGGVEPMPRSHGFASGWVECIGSSAAYSVGGNLDAPKIMTELESKAPDPIHLTVELTPPGMNSGEVQTVTLRPREKSMVTHSPAQLQAGEYRLEVDVYTDVERHVLVDRNRQIVSFPALPEDVRKAIESRKSPPGT